MYIETINSPEDVKKLTIEELPALTEEMRHALLTRASRHGGHFGPNFGMVEATIAMHYVFESPKDKIVYDVSHQSYPHKMLTGRKDAYLYEEHYDDVSGYTNPHESEHDFFTICQSCLRTCKSKRSERGRRKCDRSDRRRFFKRRRSTGGN